MGYTVYTCLHCQSEEPIFSTKNAVVIQSSDQFLAPLTTDDGEIQVSGSWTNKNLQKVKYGQMSAQVS